MELADGRPVRVGVSYEILAQRIEAIQNQGCAPGTLLHVAAVDIWNEFQATQLFLTKNGCARPLRTLQQWDVMLQKYLIMESHAKAGQETHQDRAGVYPPCFRSIVKQQ